VNNTTGESKELTSREHGMDVFITLRGCGVAFTLFLCFLWFYCSLRQENSSDFVGFGSGCFLNSPVFSPFLAVLAKFF
jgi:hypothetical protein